MTSATAPHGILGQPVTSAWFQAHAPLFARCPPADADRIRGLLLAERVPVAHLDAVVGFTTHTPVGWQDAPLGWRKGQDLQGVIGLTLNGTICVRRANLTPEVLLHEIGHQVLWAQYAGRWPPKQAILEKIVAHTDPDLTRLRQEPPAKLAALGLRPSSLANVFELGADLYMLAFRGTPAQVDGITRLLLGQAAATDRTANAEQLIMGLARLLLPKEKPTDG